MWARKAGGKRVDRHWNEAFGDYSGEGFREAVQAGHKSHMLFGVLVKAYSREVKEATISEGAIRTCAGFWI